MQFEELPPQWKRIFLLSWRSVCSGSNAIAAVITNENGHLVSEGRSQTGETTLPNPSCAHAEAEAVRSLDTSRYDPHSCVLYTGLEPCIMCMGTLVMGGIRHIEIAAQDDFGGAMGLIPQFAFTRAKQMDIRRTEPLLGDMQRAFQTLRELLYNRDAAKLSRMLTDFSVHNRKGVEAARNWMQQGSLTEKNAADYTAEEIFDTLSQIMERNDSNANFRKTACTGQ